MYKKKVTHEIVCNLHNRNHGNREILELFIGMVLWEVP